MSDTNFSVKWKLPKKDLFDYPIAVGYKCPKCGIMHSRSEDNIKCTQVTESEENPKIYNDTIYCDNKEAIRYWDELHECINCKTKYVIHMSATKVI